MRDPKVLQRLGSVTKPIWDELFPKERAGVLSLLLERVEYDAGGEVESALDLKLELDSSAPLRGYFSPRRDNDCSCDVLHGLLS